MELTSLWLIKVIKRRDRLESNNENGKMFSGFDQRNACGKWSGQKGERAEVEKVEEEEEEQMNRLNGQTKLQEERQQLKWERATKHAQQQQAGTFGCSWSCSPEREKGRERVGGRGSVSARERETWHVLLTQWKWIKRISGQSDCVGIAIDVAAAIGSSFGLMARQLGLVHISTPSISLLLPSLCALTSETTNRGQTETRWSFFASLLLCCSLFFDFCFQLLFS